MKILIAGATGYVGGRLIPRLLDDGHAVRALGRSKTKLQNRSWAKHKNLEIAEGDVTQYDSLIKSLDGCDAAFYLVHSMLPGQKDFEATDRAAALNMRLACEEAGVKRIIYLSGLGEDSAELSKHLKSRAEVAQILKDGKIPVTVLRAAMIIGSGSASFEILRYLVDRLPAMITPRWVQTPSQPIAIRNVIGYLSGCLNCPATEGKTFDIGGPEVLTYEKLMRIYAEEAGLPKRIILPVPVLTPRLSSYWIHLVTPVPAFIARPLAEGLRNPVICKENEITKLIPQKLLTPREAISFALKSTLDNSSISHWTDAGRFQSLESAGEGDAKWAGGTLLMDEKKKEVTGREKEIWNRIISIGGRNGWYYADYLWSIRGFIDKMSGGVGLRRGRRSQTELRPGDALDFWRVLEVQDSKRLLLLAEMKLPGKATLEFRIDSNDGKSTLIQTARFWPRGLWGIIYWYFLSPFHHFIFSGMMSGLAS